MTTTPLPDNLQSRLSRVYVDNREFKDDSGEIINYYRLVHEISIKGESVKIEFKLDKKDMLLLKLADVVEDASF